MRIDRQVRTSNPLTFYASETVWRSKPRRRGPAYHGTLPGWSCPHNHEREDTAIACAQREQQRRRRSQ